MHLDDFHYFAGLLRTRMGIEIGLEKLYLVESRLRVIAQAAGFKTVAALLSHVRRDIDPKLTASALDAMTTNETFFFRDGTPFDQLRNLLPELAQARQGGTLRIWSAACSTGQEPYSIAMVVDEAAERMPGLRAEIVATDVSARVIEKAKVGLYTVFETQRGLTPQHLARHFDPDPAGYRVKSRLGGAIRWRTANLVKSFSDLGMFDVIFCRNVLIYFSPENRATILNGLADRLNPGGRIFLGAAETPLGLTTRLANVAPSAKGGDGGGFRVVDHDDQRRAPAQLARGGIGTP